MDSKGSCFSIRIALFEPFDRLTNSMFAAIPPVLGEVTPSQALNNLI